MKILIIEDEPLAARRMESLVRAVLPEAIVLGKLESIRASVKWFENNPQPDLLFMDIQLADGLSFEIFQQVAVTAPVIFTTAYDEYALKAFKVNSVDYLLKPIEEQELAAAIEKFKNQQAPANQDKIGKVLETFLSKQAAEWKTRFFLKHANRFEVVETHNVLYLFAEEKVVFLVADGAKKYIVDDTLDEVETKLNPKDFFRINRKYLTQASAIERIEPHFNGRLKITLRLRDDNDIYVSREKADAFKKWLGA
ncbi:MAG: DNA-binding response regulator [Runella slithyformis]|jgi:two-component system, LytTR family, response regulator LytT|nr:MAG: DNA-binding response regulator [Runella slithyformis]TAF97213.1 MAG: DNA-binding response regulator [Runella sp.]TAG21941.1 MAG: DNA-binding response regulator [Cytophagales bacterium]TAG41115.1 MAG: DNA-binding response regulator [Cytophagia bacterium]TAE96156.1 MAG: DNA-binding response regulator [Runella slithyformis]